MKHSKLLSAKIPLNIVVLPEPLGPAKTRILLIDIL